MEDKIIIAVMDDAGMLTGVGRAPKAAIAKVHDGKIASWEEIEVRWGEAHESEEEGAHHASIAKFLIGHGAKEIVAGGAGPDMQQMIKRMKIGLTLASGGAREAVEAFASRE